MFEYLNVKNILNFIFPKSCLLCSAITTNKLLCNHCFEDLPFLTHACTRCAKPLLTGKNLLCGSCCKINPPFYKTYVLWRYEHTLPYLIRNLKYYHQLSHRDFFANSLIEKIPQWYWNEPLPEAILPMPLHIQRIKERGFNQAYEIAKPIGKHFLIPIINTVQRIKNTASQSSLPLDSRQQNIKNAFVLTNSLPYRHVALLDDVITTGFTVQELAKVLQTHNIERIDVWALARPMLNNPC